MKRNTRHAYSRLETDAEVAERLRPLVTRGFYLDEIIYMPAERLDAELKYRGLVRQIVWVYP